ncbi:MAG: 5-formyltetrahydrofolate cyclo-ligase [Rhodospirillaceae bacterium]
MVQGSPPQNTDSHAEPGSIDVGGLKAALRSKLRKKRASFTRGLGSDGTRDAAQQMADHLLAMTMPSAEAVVALYRAQGSEIDPSFLAEPMLERGVSLCLPVVPGPDRALLFRKWVPGDALEPGPFGTEHPLLKAPEIVPDVLLVPLIGYDLDGRRLGQGGGYYDRTLAQLRESREAVLAIGVAFTCQQVPIGEVPEEFTDLRLDGIVTEQGGQLFPSNRLARLRDIWARREGGLRQPSYRIRE